MQEERIKVVNTNVKMTRGKIKANMNLIGTGTEEG